MYAFAVLCAATAAAGPSAYFEPNRGQAPCRAQFLAKTPEATLAISASEARLCSARAGISTSLVSFKDARTNAHATIEQTLRGVNHYAFGSDPAGWIWDVPRYSALRYHHIYPGIDLLYHGDGRQIEFDFVIAPHAHPERIAMRFPNDVRLSSSGELTVGPIALRRPVAWQTIDGQREAVEVRFALHDHHDVSFSLGNYRSDLPLTIDPVMNFLTFLGGSAQESDTRVLSGSDGSIYLAGTTFSADFPATFPDGDFLLRPIALVHSKVYATRMKSDASSLDWSFFLGGTAAEALLGIDQDSLGDLYLLGTTTSTNFPITAGAYRSHINGNLSDLFLIKLDAQTGHIRASTYLGLEATSAFLGVQSSGTFAVDGGGSAYVGGNCPTNTPFPTTSGAFQTTGTNQCLIRVNSSLSAPIYATYFDKIGGIGQIRVDAAGNAILAGSSSLNIGDPFPAVHPILGISQTATWPHQAYIAKLNAAGSTLLFASMLHAGGGQSITLGLRLDSGGNIHVLGYASGDKFPQLNPINFDNLAFTPPAGNFIFSPFLSKLGPDGSTLLQSTFFYGAEYTLPDGSSLQGPGGWANGVLLLAGDQPCVIDIGKFNFNQTIGALFPANTNGLSLLCVDSTGTRLGLKTWLPSASYTDGTATPDGAILVAGLAAYSDFLSGTPGVVQPRFANAYFTSAMDAILFRVSVRNPTPQVQGVFPPALILDSNTPATTRFDLYGSGFAYGAQVLLNGQAINSTFLSSAHISADVDAGAVARGTNQFSVSLPAPGGGTSSASSITGINGTPTGIIVNPSFAVLGAGETKVIISATNITSDSVLNWNGTPRGATYVASPPPSRVGHFELLLEPPELAQPSGVDVTITNPGPGGGTSQAGRFTVQDTTNPTVPILSSSYRFEVGSTTTGPRLPISGFDFTPNSVAFWDGNPVPTDFVSSTRINITPPAADVTQMGNHDLYLATGSIRSNKARVYIDLFSVAALSTSDPLGQRLYLLTLPQAPPATSDLQIYDLNLGILVGTVPNVVTSSQLMTTSSDGRYVYIATGSSGLGMPTTVRRYNAALGTFDPDMLLQPPSSTDTLTISAMLTPKGASDTLVIASQNSFGAYTVRIYDRGIPRVSSLEAGFVNFDLPVFASANRIYGYRPECWTWLDYDSSGITGGNVACQPEPPDVVRDHEFVYLTDGARVIPVSMAFDPVLANVPANVQNSPMILADLTRRRVYQLYPGNAFQLIEYNLDTAEQRGYRITGFLYAPTQFFACRTVNGNVAAVTVSSLALWP